MALVVPLPGPLGMTGPGATNRARLAVAELNRAHVWGGGADGLNFQGDTAF